MKITKVEAIALRLPDNEVFADRQTSCQDAAIVKVHTDEGIVGIGHALASPFALKALVDAPVSGGGCNGLGLLLEGKNPLDIKVLNDVMMTRNVRSGRYGLICQAIGAIDIALWDVAGKFYSQPVYQLLGGAFHKKFPAYASTIFGSDGESTAEVARHWISEGFTMVKFGWGPFGHDEKLDLELIEGARRGVGDKNGLIIDAACAWDTDTAIRMSRLLKDYGVLYLEEPLSRGNLRGYQRLINSSPIPIVAGEGESGRLPWQSFIEQSGICVAQLDVERHGITDAVRIADAAEDSGIRLVNHFYTNGIGLAASLQFFASRKNTFLFEYCVEETPIRFELTNEKMPVVDGYAVVPEGAGLGVTLNEDVIERYRVS